MRDKEKWILEATCRVMAKTGLSALRIEDVATEANVSPTLVYYYLGSRANVVRKALTLADARATIDNLVRLDFRAPAVEQLRELLLLQFDETSPLPRENWIIWTQVSAKGLSDHESRQIVSGWATHWIVMLSDIIRRGQAEGSISAELDVSSCATRLTSFLHALGTRWVTGILSTETARSLAAGALDREMGESGGGKLVGTRQRPTP